LAGEVALQRQRSGVEAFGSEPFAQQYHRCDDLVGCGSGVAGGASGSRVDGIEAAELVALQESVDVLAGQPISAGGGGNAETAAGDFENDNTRLGHEP
jgi:hypothetical protein